MSTMVAQMASWQMSFCKSFLRTERSHSRTRRPVGRGHSYVTRTYRNIWHAVCVKTNLQCISTVFSVPNAFHFQMRSKCVPFSFNIRTPLPNVFRFQMRCFQMCSISKFKFQMCSIFKFPPVPNAFHFQMCSISKFQFQLCSTSKCVPLPIVFHFQMRSVSKCVPFPNLNSKCVPFSNFLQLQNVISSKYVLFPNSTFKCVPFLFNIRTPLPNEFGFQMRSVSKCVPFSNSNVFYFQI